MNFRYDSYCGLYCGACETLKANVENRVNDLAEKRGRISEDLICSGCKTAINGFFCRKCELKKCAKEQKIEFCSECSEYPCQKIIDFRQDKYSHHSIVLKNLDYIKNEGLEKWLKEQSSRWSCPECGINFSWYSEKCENCGSKVLSCKDEEEILNQET